MKEPKFFCEYCGRSVLQSAKTCPHCGRFFSSVKCPRCSFSGRSDQFTHGCPVCGYSSTKTSQDTQVQNKITELPELPSWSIPVALVLFVSVFILLFIFII